MPIMVFIFTMVMLTTQLVHLRELEKPLGYSSRALFDGCNGSALG